MVTIAIDVVILPPENIMDEAIRINSAHADDAIILHKKDAPPHISLCMGVIDENELPLIKALLADITKNISAIPLTITGIEDGHASFQIKKTPALQALHEAVMTALDSYLSCDATIETCYAPPPVAEKTLYWINNFKHNFSFAHYSPHITLGLTTLPGSTQEMRFVADTIALYQLGNYCTCRKQLCVAALHHPLTD